MGRIIGPLRPNRPKLSDRSGPDTATRHPRDGPATAAETLDSGHKWDNWDTPLRGFKGLCGSDC